MNLTGLTSRETLKVTTLEYRIEEEGHFVSEPIIEVFCRDRNGNRRMIEVEGFYPFFYISEEEYRRNEHDIFNESSIREVVAREGITSDDYRMNAALEESEFAPRKTLQGQRLVKLFTVSPKDVSDLRKFFDRTWEADIFFTNRFLIESGIKSGFSIPEGEDRVPYEVVEPEDDVPAVDPRVVTIDIEVWSGGEFPDTTNAVKPITAATVHDNYSDEYIATVLHPDAVDVGDGHTWDDVVGWESPDGVDVEVEVYDDEAQMLGRVNEWIAGKDPDILTGWNSSTNDIGEGFDWPYWINRCVEINEWTYEDLATNDKSFVSRRGSAVLGGRELLDMLQAYKKTQIHEKRSYSLEYIASEELGHGKEDLGDIDKGWLHRPADFMSYNIRDVSAVVGIEASKSVLEMYDHIRSITGADYSEIAESNIGIIDMVFLREAKKRSIALPTSVRPEVQHYWGALVFDPIPGKHRNVVYPDLSSLYPNLFRDMNASPETIIGYEDDLEESKYTKDDCHVVYVDTRSEEAKQDADSPERTKLYVLKPSVKTSFVRDVIDDLIGMKYEYKSDEYADEAYEAVKRITNSLYGCMGDSISYGVGFRLFDWRIAEAITLAGRDVLRHTADTFVDTIHSFGYENAMRVGGDTDSCVCAIPDADGSFETLDAQYAEVVSYLEDAGFDGYEETPMAETLVSSIMAAEYVDSTYDEFMKSRFNIDDGNMAVEIESYAETAFFMPKKKRYAQWIRWDEGEFTDEVQFKGFELVRSDSSAVTEETQSEVLSLILKEDDSKIAVQELLKERWDYITSGEIPLEDIGRPSAIQRNLWTYGYSEDEDEPSGYRYYTPQPHIRGSRYANAFIDGEDIESGKPLMFYTKGIQRSSDYPETYDYENELMADDPDSRLAERGRPVDAIAVENIRNLPDVVIIDYDKMAEKSLRNPIEPIVEVMGWNFDDLINEGTQSGLSDFM